MKVMSSNCYPQKIVLWWQIKKILWKWNFKNLNEDLIFKDFGISSAQLYMQMTVLVMYVDSAT